MKRNVRATERVGINLDSAAQIANQKHLNLVASLNHGAGKE